MSDHMYARTPPLVDAADRLRINRRTTSVTSKTLAPLKIVQGTI